MRVEVFRPATVPVRCIRALCSALLLGLVPVVAPAASLYLCKAYSGGSFWSQEHCQHKQALIDRIVSVPDALPFAEQVRLGEQARAEGERLRQPAVGQGSGVAQPHHRATPRGDHRKDPRAECAALESKVNALDAQARQPQDGRTQDKIKSHRLRLRERQAELHC